MTTTPGSTIRTLDVAGIGPVEVTVEDRGDGQPFLLLHGGAGPQSVSRFAQLLAEKDHHRVVTPTHPGFGGTPRPDGLHSVAGLATLYSALLDDLGLEDVTVIGNSVGGWIASEMALLGSPRVSGMVLIDAVGIEVEDHSVADVSGLPVSEIQALSFHDPTPFRVDPATIPDTQKADHGCQRRGLGRLCRVSGDGRPDAPRPTARRRRPDPGALGRERSDRASPPTAGPMPPPLTGRASRSCRLPDTCPRWRPPIWFCRRSGTRAMPLARAPPDHCSTDRAVVAHPHAAASLPSPCLSHFFLRAPRR